MTTTEILNTTINLYRGYVCGRDTIGIYGEANSRTVVDVEFCDEEDADNAIAFIKMAGVHLEASQPEPVFDEFGCRGLLVQFVLGGQD